MARRTQIQRTPWGDYLVCTSTRYPRADKGCDYARELVDTQRERERWERGGVSDWLFYAINQQSSALRSKGFFSISFSLPVQLHTCQSKSVGRAENHWTPPQRAGANINAATADQPSTDTAIASYQSNRLPMAHTLIPNEKVPMGYTRQPSGRVRTHSDVMEGARKVGPEAPPAHALGRTGWLTARTGPRNARENCIADVDNNVYVEAGTKRT
mmetsp:Transcript_7581/g.15232  ORF Transcript_7581/g.15232 Transcript_7581/m.15232 type:complete len:213 (+) Transcript_7581:4820-5458(+)